MDGHASGNLAHRRQERQTAARVGDRLVRDGRRARAHEPLGLRPVGGQVEIREEHLPGTEPRGFDRLRLLDLDDQLRLGEDLLGVLRHARSGGPVRVVGEAAAGAGARLDEDVVAVMGQLTRAAGDEADSIFEGLDLFRNAHAHGRILPARAYFMSLDPT